MLTIFQPMIRAEIPQCLPGLGYVVPFCSGLARRPGIPPGQWDTIQYGAAETKCENVLKFNHNSG